MVWDEESWNNSVWPAMLDANQLGKNKIKYEFDFLYRHIFDSEINKKEENNINIMIPKNYDFNLNDK